MLYYGIMIVLLLVMFELISRAYYYQHLSRHSIAFVQLMKDVKQGARNLITKDTARQRVEKAQEMLRPGLPKAVCDEITNEQTAANIALYLPWVEFTFRDFHGKYVNISDHIRKSVPDRSDDSAVNPQKIFFLGGSTMYGFNLTDQETIPSCFVRAYRQSHPNGRPIRVVNLGMPFYHSYQELIQLADLLFKDEKPDMVIMLDGLNECLSVNDTYKRAPAFAIGKGDTYRFGAMEDRHDQFQDFYALPPGMSVDSAAKMACRRYLDNIRHAHELTAMYHIPLYCFWQPVPYYDYPNRDKDPFCTHTPSERFERIYPMVKTQGADLPYFFFLGDMLHDETGLPFIDQIHYSPGFSQTVAEKMLSLIPL